MADIDLDALLDDDDEEVTLTLDCPCASVVGTPPPPRAGKLVTSSLVFGPEGLLTCPPGPPACRSEPVSPARSVHEPGVACSWSQLPAGAHRSSAASLCAAADASFRAAAHSRTATAATRAAQRSAAAVTANISSAATAAAATCGTSAANPGIYQPQNAKQHSAWLWPCICIATVLCSSACVLNYLNSQYPQQNPQVGISAEPDRAGGKDSLQSTGAGLRCTISKAWGERDGEGVA